MSEGIRMTEETIGRRGFLKAAAAGGLAIAGLKVVRAARASEPEGSSPNSWGMVIDQRLCTGCGQCTLACRAHNDVNPDISWNRVIARRGVPEKCSFCYQRTARGLGLGLPPGIDPEASPACVVACPVGARLFGNLNDPDSNVSLALAGSPHYRLREDLGTGPRVYYLPARKEA